MARAKKRQGFAALSPETKRTISRAGGRAAHQRGHAHEWTTEEARAAGRLGGLAAHHHERAAFHHETAAHHHQRAAAHRTSGNHPRADMHAESAYEHEQQAGEHAERAFRAGSARDEDERDDRLNENLDRVGDAADAGDETARGRAGASEAFDAQVEPSRSTESANLDRTDEPDYGVNSRSESGGTARES